MRLLLVRHGQTQANVRGSLDTAAPGPGLTELGVRQAHAVPVALRRSRVDAIYTSALARSRDTAAPLGQQRDIPLTAVDGLHEVGAGDLEGRIDARSQLIYLTTAFAWAGGDLDRTMPGGCSGHEFFERFDAAIERIVSDSRAAGGDGQHSAPGLGSGSALGTGASAPTVSYLAAESRTAVVFGHGLAIRTWVAARCRNIDVHYASGHVLENTGLVVLDRSLDAESGDWSMSRWVCEPVGGMVLSDGEAADPMGEALSAAPSRFR